MAHWVAIMRSYLVECEVRGIAYDYECPTSKLIDK